MRPQFWFLGLLVLGPILVACQASEISLMSVPSLRKSPNQEPAPPKETKVFAYLGAQYTNLVHSFAVDKASGQWTSTSTPTLANPGMPMISAVSFDKKFLATADYSANSLSIFAIQPTDGNLTLVSTLPLGAGTSPAWIVSHPSKRIFYVANNGNNTLALVDCAADGTPTLRTTVAAGNGITALAIHPSGTLLFSADQNVNQVGIFLVGTDGELTAQTSVSLTAGTQPNHLILTPDGKYLYTANWGTGTVSQFKIQGNSLVSLGADLASGAGGAYTVTVSPDGKFLFVSKPYGNQYNQHAINDTDGTLGPATVTTRAGAVSLAFYKSFAFVVSWTGNVAGIAAETHEMSAAGIGASVLNTSSALRGVYWATIVEVEQP